MPELRKARQPFWLSRAALAVFFLVFILCATSLIVLNSVITSRNGLSLTISSSSYSWTYGPTAVLIVVLSFWRRIDYYNKVREPWRELLAGPSPSKNSLLLDYITNFQVISITHAAKRRHFLIVASIAGFFLLKFIILISTALFVATETDSETVLKVQVENTFTSVVAWNTYDNYDPNRNQPNSSLFGTELVGIQSESSIWAYLSRLNNVSNGRTDWKLPDDLVTQWFALTTDASNVTRVEHPVDIFIPHVSCEDATLLARDSTKEGHGTEWRNYTFTSETCAYGGILVNPCEGERFGNVADSINSSGPCEANPQIYSSFRVNCSRSLETLIYDPNTRSEWPKDLEPFDIRYAISVADFKSTTQKSGNESEVTDMELIKSSAIICKVGYGITTANATLDPLTGNASLPTTALDGKLRLVGNLSSIALGEMLWTNLQRTSEALIVDKKVPTLKPLGSEAGSPPRAADALFQLMYAQLDRPEDLNAFYETNILKKAAISVLKGIAREFARESLLRYERVWNPAKGWVTENRLHVRPAALWTMVACFFLLCIMCLSLFFLVPRQFRWIPAMSGSLAGSAAILAQSPDLKAVLTGSSHLTTKELENKLTGLQFSATKKSNGDLEVQVASSSESVRDVSPATSKEEEHSWTPLPTHLAMLIPTFLAPLIAIGILELLHHLLQRESHFVRINGDSTTLSYIVRISSTLVIFGIATMINNLDSTIVVFAPFSNLQSGSTRPDQGILFHLLSVNPFLVMFKSLQRHQFGPAASNGATLIAGFLTIIVSGLWLPVTTLIVDHPSTAAVDNWDLGWFSSPTSDGGAGVALNLVRYGGSKTPAGIWKELVVPEISPSDNSVGTRSGANYTYSVMAVEPFLDCTAIPQESILTENLNEEVNDELEAKRVIGTSVTVQPPGIDPQCSTSSIGGYANLTFGLELRISGETYVGKYYDLPQSTAGQVSTDCPSIGMLFGTVQRYGGAIDSTLTALICSQTIRQMPVRVTYSGNPGLGNIDKVQKQGDYRMVHNGTKAHTLGFKLGGFLNESLLPFPRSTTYQSRYDSFFDHIVHRPDGHPRNTLEGVKNEWLLIRTVKEDYSEYLRHVIHRNMRAGSQSSAVNLLSATNDSSAESFQSTTTGLYSAEITHLIIDPTSKLILQILLATMTVLSFIGFLLVKIRGVLPRDPCSIGSTMALLADSQLCDTGAGILPEDAQRMDDSELVKVFDGWVFSGKLVGDTVVGEDERESK